MVEYTCYLDPLLVVKEVVGENANKTILPEVDWCMDSRPEQMPCPDGRNALKNGTSFESGVNMEVEGEGEGIAAMNSGDCRGPNSKGSCLPEKIDSR